MNRHRAIVNQADLGWVEAPATGAFRFRRKQLGAAAGARMLGASLYEVPPGASAFPRHFHSANEEAIYILDGAGTLTLGDAQFAVGRGDFIALPAGAAHAHRLANTADAPLVYLCLSTMIEPEVSLLRGFGKSRRDGRVGAGRRQDAPHLRGSFPHRREGRLLRRRTRRLTC